MRGGSEIGLLRLALGVPRVTLGVMMLETAFTRYPGDIGAPGLFRGTPILHEIVPAATVDRVVGITDLGLVEAFAEAGESLTARGACLLTTSCGFLAVYQAALAARLSVAVATSALLIVPEVEATLPVGQRVGVLTFSAASLSPAHLEAAGARPDTPVAGLDPSSQFTRAIRGEGRNDSFSERERDVMDAARRLMSSHPEVAAIVLECTNFPPHKAAIARLTGCEVYDIWDCLARAADRQSGSLANRARAG